MEDLIKKVEAIVFAVGKTISENEIAALSGSSVKDVHEALTALKKQYTERESPLLIIQEGDGWKLTVHEKYLSLVQQISPHTELNKAILETLAVIAWKQPATQSDVIKIRTNKAYEHVAELVNLGFVNKEKYGRTYLLKVTGKFFDYFDLPRERLREVFKDVKDVEEAQTKLVDQEHVKETGLDVYGSQEKEEKGKEKLGELEVFEDIEAEKEEEKEEEKPEETKTAAEKMKEALEDENPVEEFLKENKSKPAPQEVEEGVAEEEKGEEQEERKLDPELEEMAKKKTKSEVEEEKE